MKTKRKQPPVLLILFFLISIAIIVFMMFIVQSNTKVLGLPGENVNLLNNLRYSFRLWRDLEELQVPKIFAESSDREFSIGINDTAFEVCRGLSRDFQVPATVCDYMIYKGFDRTLSPGTYAISSGFTPIQMVDHIADNRNRVIQFTIFAGWRMEEIAALIDQLGFDFTGDQFLTEARNPSPDLLAQIWLPEGLILEGKSLEGYFATREYRLKPSITLQEFILKLVNRMTDDILIILNIKDYVEGAYDKNQRMIVASIIQRETLDEGEMSTIASVLYNRLDAGMRLETDPTVQYGLGFDPITQSWWKTPLTYTDLANPSDYNTYQIPGLPPGPISSPGKAAIVAAFHPEDTNYYFFRAKCDGSLTHNFAETYEEHLANGCD